MDTLLSGGGGLAAADWVRARMGSADGAYGGVDCLYTVAHIIM